MTEKRKMWAVFDDRHKIVAGPWAYKHEASYEVGDNDTEYVAPVIVSWEKPAKPRKVKP
jgi:hypothetical protein